MPPLTAELAGVTAAAILLILLAIVVDPQARAQRAANRVARRRRHAAAGCGICRDDQGSASAAALGVLALIVVGLVVVDPAVTFTGVTDAVTAILEGAHR